MLKKRIPLLFGLVVLIVFLVGIVRLFQLRFDGGDVYPAYSTLRSDPLGSKALYESLSDLPEVSVSRSIERITKLGDGRDTTLFIAGLPVHELRYASNDELEVLERFMAQGGRIVVTVFPETMRDWAARRRERLEKQKAEQAEKAGPDKKDAEEEEEAGEPTEHASRRSSLTDRWGYVYDFEDLAMDDEYVAQPALVKRSDNASTHLPDSLWWYSAVYFKELDDAWQVVLRRGDKPVLIEKRFGAGSLVLATDSYFMSNEALRKDRQPDLLAWLVGSNRRIIFNETHLGVMREPGIATLAREYRLHGFVAGLALLAALFIWKNASSFVPPHPESGAGMESVISGKDSASGFINLLRRSISPSAIVSVCFEEFKKTATHNSRLRSALPAIEQVVSEEQARPPRERKPVETYNRISRILAEKKHL